MIILPVSCRHIFYFKIATDPLCVCFFLKYIFFCVSQVWWHDDRRLLPCGTGAAGDSVYLGPNRRWGCYGIRFLRSTGEFSEPISPHFTMHTLNILVKDGYTRTDFELNEILKCQHPHTSKVKIGKEFSWLNKHTFFFLMMGILRSRPAIFLIYKL